MPRMLGVVCDETHQHDPRLARGMNASRCGDQTFLSLLFVALRCLVHSTREGSPRALLGNSEHVWHTVEMSSIPSPAALAARLSSPRALSESELATNLRTHFGGVARASESIGIDITRALQEWVDLEGADLVTRWLTPSSPGHFLARDWAARVQQNSFENALAALVAEQQLSRRGQDVGPYLRSSGSSIDEAVLESRRRAADALLRHTFSVPFHRPVVLVRALQLARGYIQETVDQSDASSEEGRKARRKLGRVIVTMARFFTVSESDLDLARSVLGPLCDEPGVGVGVKANYLEACLDLFHLTGRLEALKDGVFLIGRFGESIGTTDWPSWHLSVAEVWMLLAESADTGKGSESFLEKAVDSASVCSSLQMDIPNVVRHKLLSAYLKHMSEELRAGRLLQMRGVRLPFGLRESNNRLPDSFFRAAPRLIAALEPSANKGQYSHREVLADLHSLLAKRSKDMTASTHHLREAIRLREAVATKEELGGLRASMAQAQDLFALAELDRQSQRARAGVAYRQRGFNRLISESLLNTTPEPLILLAREVESSGPVPVATGMPPLLAQALSTGNHRTLYRMAAERALRSHDVRMRDLGGKGGVVTVEDYGGLAAETFVFKTAHRVSLERDESRTRKMSKLLRDEGMSDRFGVIEHLAMTESVDGSEGELTSIRRYADGIVLRNLLEDRPTEGLDGLLNAAEFLAYFHAREDSELPIPTPRQDIREKELGYWLKSVVDPDLRLGLVSDWLGLTEGMPVFRRRDAHPMNWLVGGDGRILAVDLETHGTRPAGYELAQLTDDFPIFDVADWDSRRFIVQHYGDALNRFGVDLDHHLLGRAYLAGLAARAVRPLSNPRASESERRHAHKLLNSVQQATDDPLLAEWCSRVDASWRRRAGLVDADDASTISQGDRRRISRAMSRYLRHDPGAPRSEDGWIEASELAQLLRSGGHRVTAKQLLLVGGALGEARFQLQDTRIRALYGHTREASIEYDPRASPKYLFHATAARNLGSIVSARAGLSPMGRQKVHLSESIGSAVRAGLRRGRPIVVLRVTAADLKELSYASGTTWVASKVPVEAIRVLTVREEVAQTG